MARGVYVVLQDSELAAIEFKRELAVGGSNAPANSMLASMLNQSEAAQARLYADRACQRSAHLAGEVAPLVR